MDVALERARQWRADRNSFWRSAGIDLMGPVVPSQLSKAIAEAFVFVNLGYMPDIHRPPGQPAQRANCQ